MTRFKLKRIVLLYCLVQIFLMDPTNSNDELTTRHTNWMTNKAVMLILPIKFSLARHQHGTENQTEKGNTVRKLYNFVLIWTDSWWNWLQILEMNIQQDCYKSLPSGFWCRAVRRAVHATCVNNIWSVRVAAVTVSIVKRRFQELTSD